MQFSAIAQLDCHQCRDHDWGMIYAGMLALVNSETVEHTVDGETIKYIRGKNGMVGVRKWNDLGTSLRVVVGKMSNTKKDINPKTWPGNLYYHLIYLVFYKLFR